MYVTLGSSAPLSATFNHIELVFILFFTFLDQPLIVGTTLTIIVIYYKLGQKKKEKKVPLISAPEDQMDTEEVKNILDPFKHLEND